MVILRDQNYPVDGAMLSFDFIRPDGEGPYPLVIFLHGGGWISGDKTMYRDEAIWLTGHGFACACIEYRLAPLYPFPIPVADCQAFVKFAREITPVLAIDPNNITAIGNSAGGHLALMLGLCETSFGEDKGAAERVNAVVDICGIADMGDPSDVHYPLAMQFLEQFMDGGYEGRENVWSAASPLNYVSQAQGRFLIIHGAEDEVVPVTQSRRISEGLSAKGVPCKYVELPGESHSFSYPAWEKIRFEYLNFLKG